MRSFLLLVALFSSTPSRAQSPLIQGPNVDQRRLAPSLEQRARDYVYLNEDKSNAADYRDDVIAALRSQGREIFDYQRVEVSGIFATDDGSSDPKNVFDGRVQPAQWGHSSSILPPWVDELMHKPQDLAGLAQDSAGELSRYAADAVSQYKDKDIDEIVAHSWGAEIMYNAIFLGKIKAPKKLVLCGVTEHNWEKWKALALYTGTEVVVYDNALDPWAQSARLADLAEEAGIANGLKLTSDPDKLDGLWSWECGERGGCNPQKRSGDFERKAYFGRPTHDRGAYYDRMLGDGTLHADVRERSAAQEELIVREENSMFGEALENAREILRNSDEEIRRLDAAMRRYIADQNRPRAAPAAPALRAAPLDPYWLAHACRDLALKACGGTNALSDDDIRSTGLYATRISVLGAEETRAGLSGCALSVFDRLLAVNQRDVGSRPSAAEVNAWAAEAQAPPSYVDPDPVRPEKPGDGCFQDPGSPRGCPRQ